MRFLDRLQPLALLVLRVVLGVIMVAHGYSKVFGGLHHQVDFVRTLGLPGWVAYLSAAAELLGGFLVIAGLLTRCAALAIAIDMGVAIWKVNWKNGLTADHGYQLPLALAAMAFALIFFGPGSFALDRIRSGSGGAKAK